MGLRPLRSAGLARQESAPLRSVRRAAEPRQAALSAARSADAGRRPRVRRRGSHLPRVQRADGREGEQLHAVWLADGRLGRGARRRGPRTEVAAGTRGAQAQALAVCPARARRDRVRDLVPVHPLAHRDAHRGVAPLDALGRDRRIRATLAIGVARSSSDRRQHARVRAQAALVAPDSRRRGLPHRASRQEGRHVRAGQEVRAEVSLGADRRRLVHVHGDVVADRQRGFGGEPGHVADLARRADAVTDAACGRAHREAHARLRRRRHVRGRRRALRKYSDGQKIKAEVRARSGGVVCSSL